MPLDVFIPGRPVAKGRPRFSRKTGRAYTPATTRKAEKALADAIKASPSFPAATYTCPVVVELEFTFAETVRNNTDGHHTCRPDLDNLVKLALDACSMAGAWSDDALVVRVEAVKGTSPQPDEVGTRIRVWARDYA